MPTCHTTHVAYCIGDCFVASDYEADKLCVRLPTMMLIQWKQVFVFGIKLNDIEIQNQFASLGINGQSTMTDRNECHLHPNMVEKEHPLIQFIKQWKINITNISCHNSKGKEKLTDLKGYISVTCHLFYILVLDVRTFPWRGANCGELLVVVVLPELRLEPVYQLLFHLKCCGQNIIWNRRLWSEHNIGDGNNPGILAVERG